MECFAVSENVGAGSRGGRHRPPGTRFVQLEVSPDMFDRLDRVSGRLGVTKKEAIRRALVLIEVAMDLHEDGTMEVTVPVVGLL